MISVTGTQTEAKVFSNYPQETALEQIQELCNQAFLKDTKIRIMPDYHAGKGCVIGTTIQLKDKVVPNLVGVDVGCGVLTVKLQNKKVDFNRLDHVIRTYVPSGQELHSDETVRLINTEFPSVQEFKAKHILTQDKSLYSLGTLGGGNHFIEVSVDSEGHHYLTIHTGSRYVGAKIANYYQKVAISNIRQQDLNEMIEQLKLSGREKEIQTAIQSFKDKNPVIPPDLAYLEGENFQDYMHDMKLAQAFAKANREEIARAITENMGFDELDRFDTVHNYIDTENLILRKGAVSAQKGERLIIPMNMRDGSILAVGKGNEDWNYSAPHGAGRILSRTKAIKSLSMEDFHKTMEGIWTTSVSEATLDEAPMAYKPMNEILEKIEETSEIACFIKPVYNFKASEKYIPGRYKKS
ncbi:RNA-splicing ligase RtcB [Lysinibacillus composti]|uniref:3'-phosphate/5'-hydroxy nucleic acid ligase n=1 Tax=Lysinibacillus composti TaxID=720633 RepID=A0A3N9UF14_9BACI|nr:RtcB family protein [Lysinibacillus composti]MBM7608489.1 RNA-splicing ligase RtcB [Lysinibacillus composti]RQW74780.1 RNA-splicing ligase RtcB [Lysinibacillus composti]